MGVLGITCGVMVWAGIALLGLHLIIEKMAWLHTLIMVGGGLYLCWMGYQMLRGALKKEVISAPAPQVELAISTIGLMIYLQCWQGVNVLHTRQFHSLIL